jgi:L-fuconolactonase
MFIADAQVHIWGPNTPERPWPPRPTVPHRSVAFSYGDLLDEMDAAGVHRALIVPPTWEGDRNDLGLEAARLYPDRFGVMGRLDTEDPSARDLLPEWRRSQPGMLGLRFHFAKQEFAPLLTEGRMDWVWPVAEKAGIPIMMIVMPSLLPLIDRVAERHPSLKIVLDHLALHLGKKDGEAFADLDALLALAKRPNVAVKASALPAYTSDTYPYRSIHPHIRRVYDAFGPQRMFWGTDLTRLKCSYRQAITMFTEELPWLGAEDKEWIMGWGLCEWLGWPTASSRPTSDRRRMDPA